MRVGIVGLGKMGLSHLSMMRAHPDVTEAVICDSVSYVLDVLGRYTGVKTYSDYDRMLDEAKLDAVIVATPSRLHAPMVRKALEHNVSVFCEKPFVLEPEEGAELSAIAKQRGLVNQVGYHNRFVGAFKEVKRLLDASAIGEVSHILAEAYGPVVLRQQGSTWRNQRNEGGGCLYDYAAHPINLLNWYMGVPTSVGGTTLGRVFSNSTEDQVHAGLDFEGGKTAQLSVDWSDESYRKMTTKITIWGTAGKIYADRQEVQVYLRDTAKLPEGYQHGWNTRYTTELTDPVWFYLRGEEYSAQMDYFLRSVKERLPEINSFESALVTDQVIGMLLDDADTVRGGTNAGSIASRAPKKARGWFGLPSKSTT